jgi:hypothetical protein
MLNLRNNIMMILFLKIHRKEKFKKEEDSVQTYLKINRFIFSSQHLKNRPSYKN